MEEQAGPPKMPRWVKVVGIIAGVVLLIAIAALAFGGGKHGPARHFSGDSTHGPGHTPPSNSTAHHSAASAQSSWPTQVAEPEVIPLQGRFPGR